MRSRGTTSQSDLETTGSSRLKPTSLRHRSDPDGTKALIEELAARINNSQPDDLPNILAALAALSAATAAKALCESPVRCGVPESPDENLSTAEAARRLGISKDYLYRHWNRLPFVRRIGRRLLFSARGLDRWNRKRTPKRA